MPVEVAEAGDCAQRITAAATAAALRTCFIISVALCDRKEVGPHYGFGGRKHGKGPMTMIESGGAFDSAGTVGTVVHCPTYLGFIWTRICGAAVAGRAALGGTAGACCPRLGSGAKKAIAITIGRDRFIGMSSLFRCTKLFGALIQLSRRPRRRSA
jgi:hypothetical protein